MCIFWRSIQQIGFMIKQTIDAYTGTHEMSVEIFGADIMFGTKTSMPHVMDNTT